MKGFHGRTVRRRSPRDILSALPIIALMGLMFVSLLLMSHATQNSVRFGQLYSWLLLLNGAGLLLLLALIGSNLYRLLRDFRRGVAGTRLTLRLVMRFVVLALVPVILVYYFSMQFLGRGIDRWFDIRIEAALEDALALSQTSLDARLREVSHLTETMAAEIADVPPAVAVLSLYDLRLRSGASELTLFTGNGRIIASSSIDPTVIVPDRPDETTLLRVRQTGHYTGLDPLREEGLHIRAVVAVPRQSLSLLEGGEQRILQALYPVPERMNTLAGAVQDAFSDYKELAYLRQPLKYSFMLTLSLVLLFSLLSAVLAAFGSARRLIAPIHDLVDGTRAVADGDYDKRLTATTNDELGFLVHSFNDMTHRIARTRDEARRSQRLAESQRAHLQAVLGHLSSGVLALDREGRLRTVNPAACQILAIDLNQCIGQRLSAIADDHPHFDALSRTLASRLSATAPGQAWTEEVQLFGPAGHQTLIARGTALPGLAGRASGFVIVFDDVTALIRAQRDAAWGEVARRLAHEIKNPLTPIQLSAERLRRKYLTALDKADAKTLDRATHTIIQQVETMKGMVNAFSEYARVPRMQRVEVDLNQLVREVLELYQDHRPGLTLRTDLDPAPLRLMADAGRLRQVLHNLIKNSQEAMGRQGGEIHLMTRQGEPGYNPSVALILEDTGPGFPDELLERLFEPYVTTKPKGTGLGLPIVKRIVEEHGGTIEVGNRPDGNGARVAIRLPWTGTDATQPAADDTNESYEQAHPRR